MSRKSGKNFTHRSYKSNWTGSHEDNELYSYRRIQRRQQSVQTIKNRQETQYRKHAFAQILKALNDICYSGNYRHIINLTDYKKSVAYVKYKFKIVAAEKNQYYEWKFDSHIFKLTLDRTNIIYLHIISDTSSYTNTYTWRNHTFSTYSIKDINREQSITLGGTYENVTKITSVYKLKIICNQLETIQKFNFVEFEYLNKVDDLYS